MYMHVSHAYLFIKETLLQLCDVLVMHAHLRVLQLAVFTKSFMC